MKFKDITTKKGISQKVVVGAILTLFGGGIVLIMFASFYGNTKEVTIDNLCGFSTATRDKLTLSLGITSVSFVPDFCTTRGTIIDPDDNSECPGNERNATACAAQQITDLALRCWNMRGAGEFNICDFECFNFFMDESKTGPISLTSEKILDVATNTEVPGKDYSYRARLPKNNIKMGDISSGDTSYGVYYFDVAHGLIGASEYLETRGAGFDKSADAIIVGEDIDFGGRLVCE